MFKKSTKKQTSVVPRRRQINRDPAETRETSESRLHGQFRRGQTLSGYRLSAAEESSRSKAHQLVRQRRNMGAIFMIVFTVIVFLTFLLWQLIAQVDIATSTKQLSRSFENKAYIQAVDEYLGLNPAERLRFALNEQKLSEYVSSKYPEVEKLALTHDASLVKGMFTITFRTPVAGWQVNGEQDFVDQAGVVFKKNYYEMPPVQIVDESGIASDEKGRVVVGNRLLGFLGKVVALAGERGYIVSEAILPQGATRQVELTFKNNATRVKLNIDRGAGEQVEDMDRALKYLGSRGESASYIDVRVSGRAAYK